MILFCLMVLALAALCLLVDGLARDDAASASGRSPPAGARPLPALGPPEHADGLRWHPEMAYHPGHTWALPLGPRRVRVGMDELVVRLLKSVDALELPRPGQRLTQGRPGWLVHVEGWRIPLLSPVSGRVAAVNSAAVVTPRIVVDEAHGRGWLLEVDAEDLRANLNNLLPATCVRTWLEADRARVGDPPRGRQCGVRGREAELRLTRLAHVLLRADRPPCRGPGAGAPEGGTRIA